MACSYAPASKLETCTFEFSLDPGLVQTSVNDHIRSITENEVQVQFFNKFSEASEYFLSGGKSGGHPVRFLRCPFAPETFAKLLSDETSKAAFDSLIADTDLPLTPEMEQTARKVYATLGYTISTDLTFSVAPQPAGDQTRQGTMNAPPP